MTHYRQTTFTMLRHLCNAFEEAHHNLKLHMAEGLPRTAGEYAKWIATIVFELYPELREK